MTQEEILINYPELAGADLGEVNEAIERYLRIQEEERYAAEDAIKLQRIQEEARIQQERFRRVSALVDKMVEARKEKAESKNIIVNVYLDHVYLDRQLTAKELEIAIRDGIINAEASGS
ncbi:MAG: hypothetical protein CVV47_06995 [Spirochaetae bacterium HGW-Spirochaetae-3]|jgi:hypothetical protein|nr:MAG: hypothetical protein CVV47_06995 [Spirochaetae bacterium HGW-Spirochaetae-3]